MDLGIKGKVAIVTGSARGLGAMIARRLAEEGAKVVINDVQRELAEGTAQALRADGFEAHCVVADITHPVLSGPAVERIEDSVLDQLVVTDTIPLREEARACRKIRQLSVAGLLAETMRRIRDEESVSSLYID